MAKQKPIVGSLVTEIKRVNGYLREIVTFFDSSGKPISQVMNPLMVELKAHDILQLFAGAFLIGAPLCFTEEIWILSVHLGRLNVLALGMVSLITTAFFIYFNFYKHGIRGHVINFAKRLLATYAITVCSIILILVLIDKFPFQEEPYVAAKRVVIIGFPALFGAILSDYLK